MLGYSRMLHLIYLSHPPSIAPCPLFFGWMDDWFIRGAVGAIIKGKHPSQPWPGVGLYRVLFGEGGMILVGFHLKLEGKAG